MSAKVYQWLQILRPYFFLAGITCVLHHIIGDYDCNTYHSQNLKSQDTISSYSEL
jgi:hypothetical protein